MYIYACTLNMYKYICKAPQGPCLDASVDAMGALKSIENHRFVLHLQRWGVPGVRWGGPWGSLRVPGTSLGGSEWSPGVEVSATDHSVTYTKENIMFLWSPLGLRHSLAKLRRLLYRVILGPQQIM